ncbi:heat-inducible transcription repressor HrcA [bacterium]|nr:heat-inducible transcription repressor HrcA [bacterium]
MELTDRESSILKLLTEVFIETAHPVGSKTIAERLGSTISSATIRNIFVNLEAKGAIEKPHTSAGRVPTNDGFRYYVSNLMDPQKLKESEIAEIDSSSSTFYTNTNELLDGVARTLAKLSKQLGIVVAPHGEDLKLFRVEYIPASPMEVFLIVSTTSGMVKSVPLRFSYNIDFRKLNIVVDLVNERLSGKTFGEIRVNIEKRFEDIVSLKEAFLLRLINSVDTIFHFDQEECLHYYGTSQLLEKPEFRETSNLGGLISLLENRQNLTRLLAVSHGQPLSIRIGGSMNDLSIVTCEFPIATNCGIVGLLGPIRMDYARAISILIYARDALSKSFGR